MSITKLEDLPNELLLDLFEYIDIQDLYYGFWHLNKRINQLIQSIRNFIFNYEHYNPVLISLFAKKTNCLIVDTDQDIDFSQFPVLSSLIFYRITKRHFYQLRSENLSNLVYLSTSSIIEFFMMSHFTQLIFSNEFPLLRTVHLGRIHVPCLRTWSQSPSISSVSLMTIHPTVIPHVLVACPNLSYFRTVFLLDTIAIFQNSPSITNHPLKNFVLFDPYHKLSFYHVYTLLSFIPNVRTIQLNFSCKIPFIRFIERLMNRVRYLRRFYCNIDDISGDKLTNIETIRQVHSCFNRIQCTTNDLNFRTFTTQ